MRIDAILTESLVSWGMDQGSYSFEKSSFWDHIAVYKELFQSLYQSEIELEISVRNGYTDSEGLVQTIAQSAKEKQVPVSINSIKQDNQYYKSMQFTIITTINGKMHRIGDGGFVDWTQQLLGNKKERFMISAIGLDRLLL